VLPERRRERAAGDGADRVRVVDDSGAGAWDATGANPQADEPPRGAVGLQSRERLLANKALFGSVHQPAQTSLVRICRAIYLMAVEREASLGAKGVAGA